jgi:multidrug efflux pump subunit AcrA (membrane-fusion protein)
LGEFDTDDATQIRAFPFVGTDRILLADADPRRCQWLRFAIGGSFAVEEVADARTALARLTADPPRVFIVGEAMADVTGSHLLAYAARHELLGHHRGGPIVFLLSDTIETAPEVDESLIPVFFRLVPTLQPERVRDLLMQAIQRSLPAEYAAVDNTQDDADRTRKIVEHIKLLGEQNSLADAAVAAIAATRDVTRSDRARCLYYDDDRNVVWSEVGGAEDLPASIGLAGYVAHTGAPLVLVRAGDDAAYRAAIDDPEGTGDERLIVQPVLDRERRVHAIVIAIRAGSSSPFSDADAAALAELAGAWSPYVHQLATATATAAAAPEPQEAVFREEAVQHMIKRGARGDVVRVHPGWINAAFWLVLLAVGALVGFAAVARVHQYAEGPSVVRVTGRDDLIAYDGGSVTSIEVATGQTVAEGQVLIRLHDTEQANKMRGLDAEFERKLVAYLQTPADPSVRSALSALVSQRESARANLDARVIRASHDGIVRDVLVTIGQRVEPGKVVASIARKDAREGLSVLAFLPGGERPRLRSGQLLRMTLPGYRGAAVETRVRAISSDVIGAAEAKARYLADRLGDSVPIAGAVVVVEAELPKEFASEGRSYELHDGMVGRTEVRLESRTVLETAITGVGGD